MAQGRCITLNKLFLRLIFGVLLSLFLGSAGSFAIIDIFRLHETVGIFGYSSLLFILFVVFGCLLYWWVKQAVIKPFLLLQQEMKMIAENSQEVSTLNRSSHNQALPTEFIELRQTFNQLLESFQDQFKKREALEKRAALAKIAAQVAHDIRSPVSSIAMFTKTAGHLPEDERIMLRDAAGRIQDIANNLVAQYKGEDFSIVSPEQESVVVVSATLLSVISEKHLQYQESNTKLTSDISQSGYLAFLKINTVEFKRMLSNLLNNAFEACRNQGEITVRLGADDSNIQLSIIDTGVGMSKAQINQIQKLSEPDDAKNLFGLGLPHAIKTIQDAGGHFELKAHSPGLAFEITLPKLTQPIWFADTIKLCKGDHLIIADDDTSIHFAWDQKFLSIASELKISHFQEVGKCLAFIESLSESERQHTFLLSDYEFIKQKQNGLDLIEQSGVLRSILVTSHYQQSHIVKRAQELNAKVLPKTLASEVECIIEEFPKREVEPVDFILVDDNEKFARDMQYIGRLKNQSIAIYHNTYDLLLDLDAYSQNTPIYLDYGLGVGLTGIEFSEVLHKKGYESLFLVSGNHFKQSELPPYLTSIGKANIFK